MKNTHSRCRELFLLLFLAALPALAASHAIFDGRTFSGWEGETNHIWRIENGAIIGGSLVTTVERNYFLATQRDYTNFVLHLKFRLAGTDGFINSGVQFRSQRVANSTEMSGYQADLGDPTWWGSIYDESRRNKVMAQSDMKAINPVLMRGDWNEYVIRAEGQRIRTYINGVLAVDFEERDTALPQWGRIGLQIHGDGKAEASFKEIKIDVLP